MNDIKTIGKFSSGFVDNPPTEEQFRALTELEREILALLKSAEKWSVFPCNHGSIRVIDPNLAAKRVAQFLKQGYCGRYYILIRRMEHAFLKTMVKAKHWLKDKLKQQK